MNQSDVTLPFLELTEAEKQKRVERAAQELAYEAAASARTKVKADERKTRRNDFRLWAHAASFRNGKLMRGPGFVWHPAVQTRPDVPYSNTRAERRRAKFGRA